MITYVLHESVKQLLNFGAQNHRTAKEIIKDEKTTFSKGL